MAIQFECPSCSKRLSVDDSFAGKRARCKCGEVVTVPSRGSLASGASASTGKASASGSQSSSTNGSSSTAMVPAVSKIAVSCSACGKKYQVDAKHAGKSMKCQCGQSLVAASPKQAALAKQGSLVAASTVASNRNSLLDELTDDDWGPKTTPVPVSDRAKVSDGEYMRAYVAKSPDIFKEAEQKVGIPSGIAFVVKLNWFMVSLNFFSGMISSSFGDKGEAVIAIAAAAVPNIISGVVLQIRHRWVWWLTVIQSHATAIASTILFFFVVAALFLGRSPEGWQLLILGGVVLGLLLIAVASVCWSIYFWTDEVREFYYIKMHRLYCALILGGLIVGLPVFCFIALAILGIALTSP